MQLLRRPDERPQGRQAHASCASGRQCPARRPGYDSNWFRQALAGKGIKASIPSSKSRKVPIPHDKMLYRQRHKIENMFGRLKDWRRIATRYDRCAHAFFSAICIAATVAFWL